MQLHTRFPGNVEIIKKRKKCGELEAKRGEFVTGRNLHNAGYTSNKVNAASTWPRQLQVAASDTCIRSLCSFVRFIAARRGNPENIRFACSITTMQLYCDFFSPIHRRAFVQLLELLPFFFVLFTKSISNCIKRIA